MKNKLFLIFFGLLIFFSLGLAHALSAQSFNMASDIRWEEVELEFGGMCICPRPPPVFYETGYIWTYWEPFMTIDTVKTPWYSPMLGSGGVEGIEIIAGKNNSSDPATPASESTFSQAHAFPLPSVLSIAFCERNDYLNLWWSEYDSTWQNDELAEIITPEAALFATLPMQLMCMVDSASTNLGFPLDVLPHCIGSSGSTYPVNGHVDNDNIIQANNTAAARLVFKLNRQFQICDPYPICGCMYTPVWFKSHYKMHTARPGLRSAWPMGQISKFYDSDLNRPYQGEKGPNDEFLWVVFRKQVCCTCCE